MWIFEVACLLLEQIRLCLPVEGGRWNLSAKYLLPKQEQLQSARSSLASSVLWPTISSSGLKWDVIRCWFKPSPIFARFGQRKFKHQSHHLPTIPPSPHPPIAPQAYGALPWMATATGTNDRRVGASGTGYLRAVQHDQRMEKNKN